MQEAVSGEEGAMAAILGLNLDKVESLVAEIKVTKYVKLPMITN